mmetsp:Transcript_41459/g.106046  ORF Transcript_41459/g.106046 Transcript_41459/m.106046 type:complete len:386 (-) Transcript_41459:737-1894(-)
MSARQMGHRLEVLCTCLLHSKHMQMWPHGMSTASLTAARQTIHSSSWLPSAAGPSADASAAGTAAPFITFTAGPTPRSALSLAHLASSFSCCNRASRPSASSTLPGGRCRRTALADSTAACSSAMGTSFLAIALASCCLAGATLPIFCSTFFPYLVLTPAAATCSIMPPIASVSSASRATSMQPTASSSSPAQVSRSAASWSAATSSPGGGAGALPDVSSLRPSSPSAAWLLPPLPRCLPAFLDELLPQPLSPLALLAASVEPASLGSAFLLAAFLPFFLAFLAAFFSCSRWSASSSSRSSASMFMSACSWLTLGPCLAAAWLSSFWRSSRLSCSRCRCSSLRSAAAAPMRECCSAMPSGLMPSSSTANTSAPCSASTWMQSVLP